MPMKNFQNLRAGLTLVEMMVVISIIAVLSGIIYASFDDARKQARDKTRMTALKELQLAVELYKAQNGTYPENCGNDGSKFYGQGSSQGAGNSYRTCSDANDPYIVGLAPEFIDSLPSDPNAEDQAGKGFYYRSDGTSYKILVRSSVESLLVSSVNDEFARCPTGTTICQSGQNDYAVYSMGAENW